MSFSTYISGLNQANGITFDTNNNLYIANSGDDNIIKIDTLGNQSIFASGFNYTENVVFDNTGFPNGYLYVMDSTNTIYKVDVNGNKTIFITNLNGHYIGMAFDKNNNLYYSSSSNNIYKIDSNGNTTVFINGSGILSYPLGIAFNNNGDLLIANNNNNYISKYDSNGRLINGTFIYIPNNFWFNLIVDKNNNIYAINNGQYINKYDSYGNLISTIYYDPTGSILGLAFDNVDNLYFTNDNASIVTKYTTLPTITSISPSSGTTSGGTSVIITGSNFLNTTSVTIRGIDVTSFTVVSSAQITCITPAGSAGTASLVVTVPDTTSATATYTYTEPVISDICFPEGTPITTDQGNFPIEKINIDIHTIHNKPIVAITKTISQDTHLVCFEKHSLGFNKPNKKTITSKNHKLYYNEKMIKAHHFLGEFENVTEIEYNGEILYNVLMEKYDKLKVNNLTFETLHPKNIIAKLYTSNFDKKYKDKIIVMINNSIMQNDNHLYQTIINRVVNDKTLSTFFDNEEDELNTTTRIVNIHNYADKSYHTQPINVNNKINLDNVTLQSKLTKYIKLQQNNDNIDEIVKKKEFLNLKKEEKEANEERARKELKMKTSLAVVEKSKTYKRLQILKKNGTSKRFNY
jgi:sugar lactone lactonase YvrE